MRLDTATPAFPCPTHVELPLQSAVLCCVALARSSRSLVLRFLLGSLLGLQDVKCLKGSAQAWLTAGAQSTE